MNDSPRSSTDTGDDWLDALLRADGREHRAGYLDDDGFTARVMAALPALPAALPAWRKPALCALWAIVGLGIGFSLPNAVYEVAYYVARVVGQPISLTGIAAGIVMFCVATWLGAALMLREL
jgi:hypothetical protein